MRKILRRQGCVVCVTGAVCAFIVVCGARADAGALSYHRVNVATAGNTTTSINQCIRDAQDGRINTAIVQCNQVSTAGNSLILKGVDIIVYPSGSWQPSLYQSSSTNATLAGGTTDNVVACLEDSRDGSINHALVECKKVLMSNSYLALTDTDVEIDG